jgi:hypothetical protein
VGSTDADSNDRMIFYNPVTQMWGYALIAPTLSDIPVGTLIRTSPPSALAWDSINTKIAPLSQGGVVWAPRLSLNFRPMFGDDTPRRASQTVIKSVLPIFAKTLLAGSALNEAVSVETMLDPHGGAYVSESRSALERDVITGAYPFVAAGRFLRVTISCEAEDFRSFDGIFVETEALR